MLTQDAEDEVPNLLVRESLMRFSNRTKIEHPETVCARTEIVKYAVV